MMLALRDASWWNRPDVYSPKVYHVVISPPYVAACNSTRMVLATCSEQPVDAVPIGLRCQHAACKSRWERAALGSTEGPQPEATQ